MTKQQEIKEKLIIAGLRNLHQFGFSLATKENILTDDLYSRLFLSMLKENLGNGKKLDKCINQLISEIPNP